MDEGLDERRRLRADDVRREEPTGRGIGDELHEAGRVLERPPVSGVRVVATGHDEWLPLLAQRALGGPGRGDLRVGEHRRRHDREVGAASVVGVQNVVEHEAHLGVGQVFELEVIGEITDRPHSGHARRIRVVGDDVSVLVDGEPAGRDVEDVAVGYPPGGEEDRLGFDDTRTGRAFEVHGHAVGCSLDARNLRVEPDVEPFRVALGEPLGHVVVERGEQPLVLGSRS